MDFAVPDQWELVVEKFLALPFAKRALQKKRRATPARSSPRALAVRAAVGRAIHHRTQIYRSTAILNMPDLGPLLFSSSNLRSPSAERTTIARGTSLKAPPQLPRKASRKMRSRQSRLVAPIRPPPELRSRSRESIAPNWC